MSVNVLGQQQHSTWARMKPEFSMLALKPQPTEVYKYDLASRDPKLGPPFLPPANQFLVPSASDILRSSSFAPRPALQWPILPRDGPSRPIRPVANKKPHSPRSPKTKSPHNFFPKSPSEKKLTDYSCHRKPAQMNGLDKVPMTGNGSSTNQEHLNWLTDVAAISRAAVPPSAQMTPHSSPSRLISPAGAATSMLARDEASMIHTTTGSLFRPPISSVDVMYSNSQFPAHSMSSGAPIPSLGPYYGATNQLTPHYGAFYSSTYSPTRPYHQSPNNSPGLLPQQFFQMDTFPSGAGMEGAMIPTQLPHSRPFVHGVPHSTMPQSPSQPNKGTRFSLESGLPYEQAHATQVERTSAAKPTQNNERHHHHRSASTSDSPTNGVSRRRDFASKDSSFEVPIMKTRILRPANITIRDIPSSVMAEAPLSAPPHLRAGSHYSEHSSLSKQPRLSIPADFPSPSHRLLAKEQNLSDPMLKNTPSSVPNFVPNPDDKGLFPAHFMKGSIIQLGNNSFRRVEDLTTLDFLQSAGLSSNLCVDSSTVLKIRESLVSKTAILGFSVSKKKVQVTVNAPMEHPFFVFNRGWSSCSPEGTLRKYGLSCHKLKVGDVCVSLTHKAEDSKTPASTPASTISTAAVSTVAQSLSPKHSPASVKIETQEARPGTRKRRSSAPADLILEKAP